VAVELVVVDGGGVEVVVVAGDAVVVVVAGAAVVVVEGPMVVGVSGRTVLLVDDEVVDELVVVGGCSPAGGLWPRSWRFSSSGVAVLMSSTGMSAVAPPM
jgi:hypothetical protein